MIYDIITFSISNQKFAVELQKVPIILSAKEYLPNNFTLINNNYYFKFSNYETELINLASLLKLKNCSVGDTTKILVGQNGDEMFGLLVDEVKEIINLNGEAEANFFENNNTPDKYFLGTLEVFNERLKIINVEEVLKKRFENHNPLL
jgi:chemotaxis signal transduction protein